MFLANMEVARCLQKSKKMEVNSYPREAGIVYKDKRELETKLIQVKDLSNREYACKVAKKTMFAQREVNRETETIPEIQSSGSKGRLAFF